MTERLRWERTKYPPKHVTQVRVGIGNDVFKRMDSEGYYWANKGWQNGVHWHTLLGWGPVVEVFETDEDYLR